MDRHRSEVTRLAAFPAALLARRLRELGLDRGFLAAQTTGRDTLWAPLEPSRYVELSDDAPAVAARLFFCGQVVAAPLAAAALGESVITPALDAGLLTLEAGGLRCPFHVRTAGPLYLLSDYLGPVDAVMGAGETTALLLEAARPSSDVGSLLDLGCGAGTLALLLAAQVRRVVATDVNPRSIAIARFNARLNETENIEFRCGSLYEPVAGETFDLIVSQPPYFPAAQAEGQIFLDGGPRGDELAQAVLSGAAAHLNPGGRAVVFAAWPGGRAPLPEGMHERRIGHAELAGAFQSIVVIRR